MRALLDVNVLIALLDSAHVHHDSAMSWLEREIHHGWASCPITQIGCIRIMSHPSYPGSLPLREVAARLGEAIKGPEHEFWPDELGLIGVRSFDWSWILGHRQVTDAYLLALAVSHGGRLVTFDRKISLKAVLGATKEHLFCIES